MSLGGETDKSIAIVGGEDAADRAPVPNEGINQFILLSS